MEKPTKSRDIPLSDFYTILQMEYISYYIRSKIYPKPYCDKYTGYCAQKKEKIEKISVKNSLPSIFSSKTTKDKYLKNFFNKKGLPNFEYRDDTSREIMGYYDRVYWYCKGTSISVDFANEADIIVVKENFPKLDKVSVKMGMLNVEFRYDEISRIISDNLTDF